MLILLLFELEAPAFLVKFRAADSLSTFLVDKRLLRPALDQSGTSQHTDAVVSGLANEGTFAFLPLLPLLTPTSFLNMETLTSYLFFLDQRRDSRAFRSLSLVCSFRMVAIAFCLASYFNFISATLCSCVFNLASSICFKLRDLLTLYTFSIVFLWSCGWRAWVHMLSELARWCLTESMTPIFEKVSLQLLEICCLRYGSGPRGSFSQDFERKALIGFLFMTFIKLIKKAIRNTHGKQCETVIKSKCIKFHYLPIIAPKNYFSQFFYKFLEFVFIVGRANFTHFYKFLPNQVRVRLLHYNQMGKKKHPTQIEAIPLYDPQPRISSFLRGSSPEREKDTSHAQTTQGSSLHPIQQSYEDIDESSNAVGFHQVERQNDGTIKFRPKLVRAQLQHHNNSSSATLQKGTIPNDEQSNLSTMKQFQSQAHQATERELDHADDTATRGRDGRERKKRAQELSAPHQERMEIENRDNSPRKSHSTNKVVKAKVHSSLALPLPLPPLAIDPLPKPSHISKLEQIRSKPPCRQRFSHCLPEKHRFQIGHPHRYLLQIMKGIDNSLNFLTVRQRKRGSFFTDLASGLKQHRNGMEVRLQHLQQLLFLDETLYTLKWEHNQKAKKRDLMVHTTSAVNSEDNRQHDVYGKIVEYLQAKQFEFLAERGEYKTAEPGWSKNFNPQRYKIPLKPLPLDPIAQSADFKFMKADQIDRVSNPSLRSFIHNSKQADDQSRSVSSSTISHMILNKLSVKAILTQNFKIAEESNTRKQLQAREQGKCPQKAVLLQMLQEIMMAYMSRNVSSMFRKTLVDKLNLKLTTIKKQVLAQGLEFITSSKEIAFLEEKTTSTNDLALIYNRSKFEQMKQKIKELPR